MKYLAAYSLLVLGGNATPSAADVKKVLGAVEAEVDDSTLNTVIESLKGKPLNEIIAAGLSKVPSLGGGRAAAAAPAQQQQAAKQEAPVEEKKEEEEEMDLGGGGLFGDDEDY
ncbi:hypothetical protein PPERSA_09665 [Pseudocohnilembus persalinus]|uniref:60S acidic ribosomal protein P2 n=1 Tax=Pseudocohnilembus persalinus TaxID=266149 RepID=A0A0V0R719_PSEPJ|nr:hypothetical protein PPERSA_09665 [Pseudocohnilembus persalinus]|eukprot:KRX10281.1 hypothetical protein PPERSA_09665 [Pseudocohnilembus persalinus]